MDRRELEPPELGEPVPGEQVVVGRTREQLVVDLRLVTMVAALPDLVHVWRGDVPWSLALREGDLRLEGPPEVRRAVPHWLKLSTFAGVPR